MTTKPASWPRTFVAGVLLLATLACNLSPEADPTPTPEPAATASPSPSPTPEPDPVAILDTYASLATVRQRLDDMAITLDSSGTSITGRSALDLLFSRDGYDPTDNNASKENVLFAAFDGYTFPHIGARIYLISVATGLWAEAHELYPWSLAEYSEEEINNLFIENESTAYNPDPALHRGDLPAGMPNTRNHSHPNPPIIVEAAHYKQFNLAGRLTEDAATQGEAAGLIVVWMQHNFFHSYSPGYTWEEYLDGREPRDDGGPVAYPTTLERIYEERVSGCHEPTMLLEGMLHSLNIPAVRLMVHGHGVLYLPTLDKYIHGDHIVGATDAPPGILLLTAGEFRPFAEDAAWIYQIKIDKWTSVFGSLPLYRDGGHLYIQVQGLVQGYLLPCIEVSEEEWTRIEEQLPNFNLAYDDEGCTVTSDLVPIWTLDELNDIR